MVPYQIGVTPFRAYLIDYLKADDILMQTITDVFPQYPELDAVQPYIYFSDFTFIPNNTATSRGFDFTFQIFIVANKDAVDASVVETIAGRVLQLVDNQQQQMAMADYHIVYVHFSTFEEEQAADLLGHDAALPFTAFVQQKENIA